ncbi:hypothetical protein M0E87_11140 [Corynebacterium sp. CCM 9185]|uniref:ABC-2 family transporter protein n=1 Tax=Corynebacterium marambiense TaxID=2765364 RepID=A0ABS0VYH5_9CORY|nr:hypothetical protein [Corynebacterium marambiense]MBI9000453.1 hypothetical protein [Corynebacterium marambiense]MCK7664206.1 hypothetical protein [Corynebacterium marambiense]MCX7543486.1 hypothetical protein [Corynebacterium marambiense]
MNTLRAQLYTATRLTSVRASSALTLLAIVLSCAATWALPVLLTHLDLGAAVQDERVAAALAAASPASSQLQRGAFDVFASTSSDVLTLPQLTVIISGILIGTTMIRHGAVCWQIIDSSRTRVSASILCTSAIVAAVPAAIGALLCWPVSLIAMMLHDVDFAVDVPDLLLLQVRGIVVLTLVAVLCAGLGLVFRSLGGTAAAVAAVAVVEFLVTAVSALAGLGPRAAGWLPLQSARMAIGLSDPTGDFPSWAGLGSVLGWTVLVVGLGVVRFHRYNL